MKDKFARLDAALKAYNEANEHLWGEVVDATNELVNAPDWKYNAYSFPAKLENRAEYGALRTGWIYARLEHNQRRDTNKKIRRALGFSYP